MKRHVSLRSVFAVVISLLVILLGAVLVYAADTSHSSAKKAAVNSSTQQLSEKAGNKSGDAEMPQQDFEACSSRGIKVTAEAPKGAFPKGTTMSVKDVSRAAAISIAKKSTDTPKEIVDASGVDITFKDKNGQEIEPANGRTVKVKMQLSRELKGKEFHVIHNEGEKGPAEIADAKKSSASFRAESFSIYLIEGENPAVATYKLHDSEGNLLSYTANGKSFSEQKIKNGETLYSPKNPEKSGYIFQGWTTTEGSDTVELEPFKSTKPSVTETQEIDYYPVFKEAHYVFFMDSTGDDARVYQTKEGASGDTITVSDVTLSSTGTTSFTGWYTDSGLTDSAGDSVTLGDKNIYLYPKFEEGHYLVFKTGDDATIISPEFVAAGDVTTAPDDPERDGYRFVGWSTTENSTIADFSFGGTLTETTTLYAVWKPTTANYTVIFWKQSVTDDKDAADADKTYEYAGSETRSGTTGSDASATSSDKAKSSINNGVGFHFNSTNTVDVQIKGDGSTILNIYYDRDLFTYNFYESKDSLTPQSSISGLYGATMDQSGVEWPEGSVWVYILTQNYYPYIDAFLPVKGYSYSGNSAEIDFYKASSSYTLNYYREAVTGGGFTSDLTPQTFSLDTLFGGWNFENVYSGFSVSKFRVMDRSGNYGKWVSVSSDGTTSMDLDDMMYYSGVSTFGGFDVFYSRNQHKIDYYSGNEIVHTETGIYYEASLADYGEGGDNYYEPTEAPSTVPEGSVFAGWYKDPDCTVLYDFANATMPDDDVIVYAKWELPTVKADVYDEMGGGDLVDTITVDYGGTVDENLMPNVVNESGDSIVYTSSSETITIPDDAIWIGWDVKTTDDSGETSYETYSFDTQLTKDIELYPNYLQLNKYKVTYDANGGSGTVTDSKTYAGGDDCYADVQSGSTLTSPDGKVFLYWNIKSDGSGDTYYPDDKVQITSDVTLYAIYGDAPEVTDLTYYSNYPSDTDLTNVSTKQTVNSQTVLLNNQNLTVYTLNEADMTTPSGYKFVGWNTAADGSGTSYAASTTIGVDVEDPQPNALYAIWAKKPTKDVFQSSDTSTSIDGDTVKAGDELLYKITYKNTTASAQTVTITDSIPDNSTYVDDSADHNGTYSNGKLTWSDTTVADGESMTVSFKVKVKASDGTVLKNKAVVNDGTNTYTTNVTKNPTPENQASDDPRHGDKSAGSGLKVKISARKILSGGTLQNQQFSFELRDQSGKTVRTAENRSDGSIAFSPLSFKKEGTWTYTIREVLLDDESSAAGVQNGGVTYDETVYVETVKVTRDSETGKLKAVVISHAKGSSKDADPIFTNKVTSNGVKTGDRSDVNLYLALLLSSTVMMAILTVMNRKKIRRGVKK
jgi:pilin isopeptide linkage protein/uncharacterized repeat protein (TIGR01451 family)/uncharacterized repeat protein (TIGR02543 family)